MKPYIFDTYFDRVFIISLASRPERLARCLEQLEDLNLSAKAEVFNAFDGNVMTPPKWFTWGNGAWGAFLSQTRIIQDLLQDPDHANKKILILEDDALFFKDAYEMFEKFMAKVGDRDWGQLYLGGQHIFAPEEIEPGLFKCNSVNRVHAYAVNGAWANRIQMHLMSFDDYVEKNHHVDKQYEMAHRQELWPVFAPTWWIAGQRNGMSDVSLRYNRAQWWDLHDREKVADVPFVCIDCDSFDYADFLYEEKIQINDGIRGKQKDNVHSIYAMAWMRRLLPAFRGDHEMMKYASERVTNLVFLSEIKDKLQDIIDSRVKYE